MQKRKKDASLIIKYFWDRRVFGQAGKSMGEDRYMNDKFEGDLHFCKKCIIGQMKHTICSVEFLGPI